MDRLPADKFGTSDWVEARINDVRDQREIRDLPAEIEAKIKDLLAACKALEIPVFVAVSLRDLTQVDYELGDKPENCNQGFMLARGVASGIAEYNMGLVMNPAVITHGMRQPV